MLDNTPDGMDRFLAGVLTVIVMVFGGLLLCGLVSAFLSAPVITTVVVAVAAFAFKWVYPYVLKHLMGTYE